MLSLTSLLSWSRTSQKFISSHYRHEYLINNGVSDHFCYLLNYQFPGRIKKKELMCRVSFFFFCHITKKPESVSSSAPSWRLSCWWKTYRMLQSPGTGDSLQTGGMSVQKTSHSVSNDVMHLPYTFTWISFYCRNGIRTKMLFCFF